MFINYGTNITKAKLLILLVSCVQHNYGLVLFSPGSSPLYCDFVFLVLFGSLWLGFLVLFGGPGPGPGPVWRDSTVPENSLITKKILNNALNIYLALFSYRKQI